MFMIHPMQNTQVETHASRMENDHISSPSLPYHIASAPWDSVSVDLLKLPLTEYGYQYLLVCMESFTRFTIVALKDKTANYIGRASIDNIICPDSPRVILSDNGAEFNNGV